MGTIFAQSYSNILMDNFEKNLYTHLLKGFSLIYLRFINDILFIYGLAI